MAMPAHQTPAFGSIRFRHRRTRASISGSSIPAHSPRDGPSIAPKTVIRRLVTDYDGTPPQARTEPQAGTSRWTTFADIEGNEFDLIAG
jgi:hypothetical protein